MTPTTVSRAARTYHTNKQAAQALGVAYNTFMLNCRKHEVTPPSERGQNEEAQPQYPGRQTGLGSDGGRHPFQRTVSRVLGVGLIALASPGAAPACRRESPDDVRNVQT